MKSLHNKLQFFLLFVYSVLHLRGRQPEIVVICRKE
jgi:hypothetical protein